MQSVETVSGGQGKRSTLTIMAFPAGGDAYTDNFYRVMKQAGVRVIDGVFSLNWLYRNLRDVDYVHMHWPSFSYRHASRVQSAIRFTKLCLLLLLSRLRGAALIWTAHNLYPHDRNSLPILDKLCRRIITRAASHVLVHGPTAARIVEKTFPATRGKLTRIWHGHFIESFPRDCSRAEARAKLEIPADAYVYGFVGVCKPYKDLERLITTFQAMKGSAWLLIAGRFQDADYQREIEKLIANKPERIRLCAGFIPDDELQYYFAATDVVVTSYLEVLTSGSAIAALSFGRPVVAPRIGFLEDVIVPEVGVLFDPRDANGLAAALAVARGKSFDEAAILDHVRQYDWDEVARIACDALVRRG